MDKIRINKTDYTEKARYGNLAPVVAQRVYMNVAGWGPGWSHDPGQEITLWPWPFERREVAHDQPVEG